MILLLVLAVSAPRAPAPAAQSNVQLERVLDPVPSLPNAEGLYQNADFAQSILMLDKLLRTELPEAGRKQAKFLLGLNFLAIGNETRAQVAFQDLLDIDPDFTLPTFSSPSVRTFFNKVKAGYKIIPQIEHIPPTQVEATQGAQIVVTLKRMRKGYQPKLFFRTKGAPYYSNIDLALSKGTSYVARVPPAMLLHDSGYQMQYFIVVTDGDQPLTQLRSPQAPFSAPVNVPVVLEAKPVYKRWYFWLGLTGAAVVAGGVVAAVLLTRPQAQPYGNADVAFRF